MAYTRAWTTNVSGSAPANTIDTLISNVRVDLQERLLSSLLVNLTADPVVVRDEILGKKTGKKILIPFCAFVVEASETHGFAYDDVRLTMDSAVQPVKAALVLPNTVVITRIKWLVAADDAGPISLKLQSAAFSTGISLPTDENIQTKASSGQQVVDSGVVAITIGNGKYYWLRADKTSGAAYSVYGVEVTYDTPNSLSTL